MKSRPFAVSSARLTHREAPLSALEGATDADPADRLHELHDREGVAEAAVLRTCNRIEEYVVAETEEAGREALSDFAPGAEGVVRAGHEASLRHLLRVAAGLESQVLGEDQILGQVRDAYTLSREEGTLGPVLEAGLLKAIHVGERARTETGINDGTVSLGSAAVKLAERECGLEGRRVLVLGAGEMAELVARALPETVSGVHLANRTPERAESLREDLPVPATAGGLGDVGEAMREADVVVSATASPDPVVEPGDAAGAGETLVIDLGQPRDVDSAVADEPGVSVCDLDALEVVTEATHRDRRDAAREVEALCEEEFDLLLDQYKRKRADAVISAMYRGAERIKQRELDTAFSALEAADPPSDAQREVVKRLADALVSQLLAVPTRSLRDAASEDDWETITTALELFDPELDAPPGELLREGAEGAPAETED